MNGQVQLFHDEPIHGPYVQDRRQSLLTELLQAQEWIRKNGPATVREIELISPGELEEIRRIWVSDKHEIEDVLPKLYEEVTGRSYEGANLDDALPLGAKEVEELKELCTDDPLHFELVRELLDVERKYKVNQRRAGLTDAIESAFKRSYYDNRDDAVEWARRKKQEIQPSELGTDLTSEPELAQSDLATALYFEGEK